MKNLENRRINIICILIFGVITCSCSRNVIQIDDSGGALGKPIAPVSSEVKLSKSKSIAAEEGRLGILDHLAENGDLIPVQIERKSAGAMSRVDMLMPEGDRMNGMVTPPKSLAPSPGHELEWVECIKSRKQPSCNPGYHVKVDIPIELSVLSM